MLTIFSKKPIFTKRIKKLKPTRYLLARKTTSSKNKGLLNNNNNNNNNNLVQ